MNEEIAQLQSQLNQLAAQLEAAKGKIKKLEQRRGWRSTLVTTIGIACLTAVGINSWSVNASFPSNATVLAGQLGNLPTKLKAPFEVVDSQGKTILLVQDKDSEKTQLPRGAYIYSQSGKPVVDLSATTLNGGGGRVRTTSEDEQTYSAMGAVANVAIVGTYKGGKRTTMIGTDEENPGVLKVYREDGQRAAATLEQKAQGGELNVFGTGDKPVASIQNDAGDGKLWINDKGGQPVAGVFASDNGGVVKVMKSGEANTYTAINAIGAGLGMVVRQAGKRLVFAGAKADTGDAGSVLIYAGSDNAVAGMSTYGGGKGLVGVFNQSNAIAFLSESDKHPGGGNLTVSDPGGNGIFSAGFTGEAGDACVTRKNGLWCMGTNLPLQMK